MTESGGLWAMARNCEARIAELTRERLTVPRSERRPIHQRIHAVRDVLIWLKTRAGYVDPGGARAILDN
jgi:hypothetical protein